MNFTCNREILLKAVSLVGETIPRRPIQRPVLNNIRFSPAADETLELAGSDMEMGIRLRVPLIEAQGLEGRILLPALQLLGILKESTDKEISIEIQERTAVISGRRTFYRLPSFPEEGFPEIPEIQGAKMTLRKDTLRRLVSEVAFAMNKEREGHAYNSLLLCLKGRTMEAVATDQIRLAYALAEEEGDLTPEERRFVIPSFAIPVLSSLFENDEEETVSFTEEQRQLQVSFKNGYFITRLEDVQYPNYREAYRSYRNVTVAEIATEDFARALRQIVPLTCEGSRHIAMTLAPDLLELKAVSSLGEGKVDVPMRYGGERVTVGVNPFFIQDFLKEIAAQEIAQVNLRAAGPKAPIILYPHENYLYFMSPAAVF